MRAAPLALCATLLGACGGPTELGEKCRAALEAEAPARAGGLGGWGLRNLGENCPGLLTYRCGQALSDLPEAPGGLEQLDAGLEAAAKVQRACFEDACTRSGKISDGRMLEAMRTACDLESSDLLTPAEAQALQAMSDAADAADDDSLADLEFAGQAGMWVTAEVFYARAKRLGDADRKRVREYLRRTLLPSVLEALAAESP